jgi:hypothetical protein
MRSMSLVTPEELPPHYQARYFHPSPMTAGRISTTTGMASSSLYGHGSQDTATIEPHSAIETSSLANPAHAGAPVGFTFPQWDSYPSQSTHIAASGPEGYSQEWYTGSSHLGQVREETGSSHQYRSPLGPSHHQRNPG